MVRVGGRRLIMKSIALICPKCNKFVYFNNYWHWVWKTPFHWFGKRYTKCDYCGKWSWMKKEK